MLRDRRSFDPQLLGTLNEKHLRRRQNSLRKYAASLGFELFLSKTLPVQFLEVHVISATNLRQRFVSDEGLIESPLEIYLISFFVAGISDGAI